VSVFVLDEQQGPGFELERLTVDESSASSADDKQPLVSRAMAIVGVAFSITGRDHHFRDLRPAAIEGDPETFAEPKLFPLHAAL